ncbi:thioredoxin family protein [Marinactinospora thermotolerans]|uniref:Thioredoxin n=1 Tax=Marinactinospora thermotolerans DSM 45154 TaxID=1122192 RepID=A0A1T4NHW6_9ACTN|nr:thioredoxin domain-containing protein [Marinactinospora thermotolerans]SJZ78703.1 thioredoxin [Marinactinospora thermotolerans DSM 45154]
MADVHQVTTATFDDEVTKATEPVLVEFWSVGCPACRVVAPTVRAVAERYEGRAKVVRVNVDENPASALEHGVNGLPLLVLFKDGAEVDRVLGTATASKLEAMIDRAL